MHFLHWLCMFLLQLGVCHTVGKSVFNREARSHSPVGNRSQWLQRQSDILAFEGARWFSALKAPQEGVLLAVVCLSHRKVLLEASPNEQGNVC